MNKYGFTMVFEREVPEVNSKARLWKHEGSGAELLSMLNTDENKVFGVTFRTPPTDSTGVAHILEHSVLCGSSKYPVKEPFVELLKGSLQSFLNAFTYPDKTCYPVASTNLADFYHLVDVYLDAVFYPIISPEIFKQEGWHFEVDPKSRELSYKGVVYNEMKGVFSSPESLLARQAQQALFPDNPYGVESGGDPEAIPQLTYEQFKGFHDSYYHPSNARFYFWGDDDEDKRLELLNELLKDFTVRKLDSSVALQQPFTSPRLVEASYAAEPASDIDPESKTGKAMLSMNWLLAPSAELELNFALRMLEHMLIGLPSSPLRKALLESGLGEDVIDDGLETELRQLCFSVGLKGIDQARASTVEMLIMDTLAELSEEGLDSKAVEAAFNSVEFSLREKNTGRFPVGLAVMLQSLTSWLYDGDPLAPLSYEPVLKKLRDNLAADPRYFEKLIKQCFLDNEHRVTVLLLPDETYMARLQDAEKNRLAQVAEKLSSSEIKILADDAAALKKMQETPDKPEDLAKIPHLEVGDLPLVNRLIVREEEKTAHGLPVYYHPQATSGLVYLNMAFKLASVPVAQIPLLPLLARALTEMGTKKRGFVDLSLEIACKTGGMSAGSAFMTSLADGSAQPYLMLSGKSTLEHASDLFALLQETLTEADFSDLELFKRMLLEEKAREEHSLIPSGHMAVLGRLKAGLNMSGWLEDQGSGLGYLFNVRELAGKADNTVLENMHGLLQTILHTPGAVMNLTAEESAKGQLLALADKFHQALPQNNPAGPADWAAQELFSALPQCEALLVPAQVNYVGKALDLFKLGYKYHGSMQVILKHLRTSWLWEKVRVQGGAYGAFCFFDRASGVFAQASYRDPNVQNTLQVFNASAEYLRDLKLSKDDLSKSIIGAIGELDAYLLPDAKGYNSFCRALIGDTDQARQKLRDEMLSTTSIYFNELGALLSEAAASAQSRIVALGGDEVRKVADEQGWAQLKLL